MDTREFKVLRVKLLDERVLIIPSHQIKYVESLEQGCRVYFAETFIDIDQNVDWMRRHLEKGYEESVCNEI